jgi:thiol-disulfide isomerase/thioredoxin
VAGVFFFKKNSEAPPDKGNVTPDAVGEVAQVETFDQVFSHKLPVLAELGANWCAPCKQMRPIILGLKKEFSGLR